MAEGTLAGDRAHKRGLHDPELDDSLSPEFWFLKALLLARQDLPGGDRPIHKMGGWSESSSLKLNISSPSESSIPPMLKIGSSFSVAMSKMGSFRKVWSRFSKSAQVRDDTGSWASEMDKWRRIMRLTAMAFSANASSSLMLLFLWTNNHYGHEHMNRSWSVQRDISSSPNYSILDDTVGGVIIRHFKLHVYATDLWITVDSQYI